jgi:cell division septation protein DedD
VRLSQDTAPLNDDAFHEIQLSGKQLVFLFMATTVVSVFIFLCGVLVGRGVRAERGVEAAEPAAVTTPVAEAPVAADAGPPSAEPPPAAENDELSYHKRLQGDAAPQEQLKPQAEATPRPADPAPAAPAPAVTPAGGPQDTWVVQLIVLRNRAEATTSVPRLAAKGYPAFVVEPAAGGAVRAFKVQVGRYSDRREAEQAARRLEKEEQFKPWILR